jgi:ubiquinone/menaquinone biosynthesis C-methylase UbiE
MPNIDQAMGFGRQAKGLKLHLGCGRKFIPGFVHIDALHYDHVDYCQQVGELGNFATSSVSLIYACHVLEHFSRWHYMNVLAEWFRVLEPGGVLRLSVPDFAACAKLYYEEGLQAGLTGLVGLVVGGQRDQYDFHGMIFDEPLLTTSLHQVGFKAVQRWDWRQVEHGIIDDYSQAYLPHMDKEHGVLMSLNLEASA